jgi:uracil-DNA glycosylase
MVSTRRAQYLQALGIDVWLPRRNVPEAPDLVESVVAPPVDAVPQDLPCPDVEAEPVRGHAGDEAIEPITAPAAPGAQAGWDALREEVATCTKCSLHSTRIRPVFGVGNVQARWLVVGEAPGAEEDKQGEPFVGRAGKLLDSMLRAIGLDRRSNVYIANILKSRPPNNRDPRPEEVIACLPYLKRQIALIQPLLILAVGRIAAQNLLGTTESLSRLRGRIHTFGELNTPLIVTYHPAYLLRTPADKRKAWEDLKFARNLFRQLASGESESGGQKANLLPAG